MFKMQSYFKLILLLSIYSTVSLGEDNKSNPKEKDPNAAWYDEKAWARFKGLDENGMLKNPIKLVNPPPKTAHQNKKFYGHRKGSRERSLNKMLPNCTYVPGYRDPDLCVTDGKVVYKRGWDKRILDRLHKEYELKLKAYQGLIKDNVKNNRVEEK